MEWKDSVTRENLLRAFAGESQARNRYTFAAATAKKKGLHLIEAVFLYTADQERAHAKVFYTHLQEGGCDSGLIAGAHYPVDVTEDVAELLDLAQTHETEEWDSVYPSFARKAEEEGFEAVARHFRQIAEVTWKWAGSASTAATSTRGSKRLPSVRSATTIRATLFVCPCPPGISNPSGPPVFRQLGYIWRAKNCSRTEKEKKSAQLLLDKPTLLWYTNFAK